MDNVLSNITRNIANLLSIGTIAAVEHSFLPRVKVRIGGLLTRWIAHPAYMGRNWRGWFPARVGQQVVTGARSGETTNSEILSTTYSSAAPSPSDNPGLDLVQFEDGTRLSYDSDAGHLRFESIKDVTITAAGTITLDAKNIVFRTREHGFHQVDNHGRASRLTHVDGPLFKQETWTTGSTVTALPDYGYHPPKVEAPE
jgi:phage baseplate assembly protein V